MTLLRVSLAIDMTEARILAAEHISDVALIEKLCFSEPWSEESLGLLLRDGNFGVVCVNDGRAVAYGGMTCCLDEGAVTNIAVHPELRRKGLGRQIVRAMLREAEKRGIKTVFLEVRESNSAARTLYASEGFLEIGRRKNFYRAPTEDAIAMAYYFEK